MNIDKAIYISLNIINNNNDLAVISSSYGSVTIYIHHSTRNVEIESLPDWGRNCNAYLTIQYTKTTS